MKRLMPVLFAAYLTIGQNHNFQLGNGHSVGFEIDQPVTQSLSLIPSASFDNNDGFRDRNANVELSWAATKFLTFSMGAGYDKYTLTGVSPTEDGNVHTSMRLRVW